MNTEQIFKLLDAGFTAEEIRGFMPKAEEPPKQEVIQEEKKAEDPKPEIVKKAEPEIKKVEPIKQDDLKKADAVEAAINKAVADRFEQQAKSFEDLFTKMAKAAGIPTLAEVTPKGVEDIITNFFKED